MQFIFNAEIILKPAQTARPRQQETTVLWIPLQKPHFPPALLNRCSGTPWQVLVICPAMKTMKTSHMCKQPCKGSRQLFCNYYFWSVLYSVLFTRAISKEKQKQEKPHSQSKQKVHHVRKPAQTRFLIVSGMEPALPSFILAQIYYTLQTKRLQFITLGTQQMAPQKRLLMSMN